METRLKGVRAVSGGDFGDPGGRWCCLDQGGTLNHEEKDSALGYIWEEELLGLADQWDVRHLGGQVVLVTQPGVPGQDRDCWSRSALPPPMACPTLRTVSGSAGRKPQTARAPTEEG